MLNNVLLIVLGAGLASVGFIAAAIADRLRTPRMLQEAAPREQGIHAQEAHVIPIKVSAELLHPATARSPRVPRIGPKVITSPEGGEDVITALVASGYKKSIATEATRACTTTERATIEGWARAALARVGQSSSRL